MSSEADSEELKRRIDGLSRVGVRFVTRLVDSVSSPPTATTPERSWINGTPEWVEYFGYSLAGHHGVTAEPLGLTGFEVAFRDSSEAVGWECSDPGGATQRFVDMTVSAEGSSRKLSLKSTAAQRLSKSTIHISKLTEAAWIQDMRSARDRQNRTLELFESYREAVDAIMMLRAFRDGSAAPKLYQLVEIPVGIFDALWSAPTAAFSADGPTIDCAYRDDPVAARVSLDRSDAKITIRQIKLSACTVHAEWRSLSGPKR